MARFVGQAVLVAVLVAVAGSCAGVPRFGAPDPVTADGNRILSLWQGSVVTALAVGALVWALIAWSVVRYRRRRGADGLPGQRADNLPVEIAYTLTPILIVAILFGFTVFTQEKVTARAARPDVVVDVIGYQWQWQFRYPDEGVVVTGSTAEPRPTMVLPVGSTVRLRLSTTDVIHSFWVPRFLKKLDLVPGLDNELDVVVEDPGVFPGRCAEFCGLDHARMDFRVEAVSPAAYRTWLDQERTRTREAAG
jgi:cytochrome c oxidase subunit 2